MQATTTPRSTHSPARALSLRDNLEFNLVHVIPNALQGTFVRSPFWVNLWTRLHPDPLSVRFIERLRRKYQSDYLLLQILGSRTLLVLDHEGIRHVLENSPTVYADPRLKRDGMSHFQPNALTISRGEAWTERRRFNEEVLDTGRSGHRLSGRFLEIVREEVGAMLRGAGGRLVWKDFEKAFERIALGVIFGAGARGDTELTDRLTRMMRESNRPFGRKRSRHFDGFYARIREYLQSPEEGSLAWLCQHTSSGPDTAVESQIPHWIFAIKDTLATNTVRALALIVSHPPVEARVRDEMAGADLSSALDIDGMSYLEGCLHEAMRLWPTTPMLVREVIRSDAVGGLTLSPGTQVLVHNGFNHRDRDTFPDADAFSPEVWQTRETNWSFNHLSNGPQVCAGKDLALLVGKAVLAMSLEGRQIALEEPPLSPNRPIPHAFNYFRVRFAVRR